MQTNRKELFLVIGAVLLVWMLLVVCVTRWHASRVPKGAGVAPELPHFPGTESIQEQESENLGWRKYWFTLEEDFPSTTAYQFYQKELSGQGWRPVPEGEPQWVRQETKDEARDLFQATWLAPNRLYRVDLEMMSVVKERREGGRVVGETREPGIKVFVTLQRVLDPALLFAPSEPEAGKGEIEVK